MKTYALETTILSLKETNVKVIPSNAFPESGQASIILLFSDGTKLQAAYWRFIKNRQALISSFDDLQKYGLPAPIDAIEELTRQLDGQSVQDVKIDRQTGDLVFDLTDKLILQIFNFTSYEIREINFPNGTREYSNRILGSLSHPNSGDT